MAVSGLIIFFSVATLAGGRLCACAHSYARARVHYNVYLLFGLKKLLLDATCQCVDECALTTIHAPAVIRIIDIEHAVFAGAPVFVAMLPLAFTAAWLLMLSSARQPARRRPARGCSRAARRRRRRAQITFSKPSVKVNSRFAQARSPLRHLLSANSFENNFLRLFYGLFPNPMRRLCTARVPALPLALFRRRSHTYMKPTTMMCSHMRMTPYPLPPFPLDPWRLPKPGRSRLAA